MRMGTREQQRLLSDVFGVSLLHQLLHPLLLYEVGDAVGLFVLLQPLTPFLELLVVLTDPLNQLVVVGCLEVLYCRLDYDWVELHLQQLLLDLFQFAHFL
jgi:hypothetical protein